MSRDLLETGWRLATLAKGKPLQSDLKRAISTAYYAVFHALAKNAADIIAGVGRDRPEKAWVHTYRAIEHRFARDACQQAGRLGFPPELVLCADLFVELQERRHLADYDPTYKVIRADALESLDLAKEALAALQASSRRDRKAFAIQLLLRRRR